MVDYKSFKGRTINEGEEVFVYRNLHNDLWSVRSEATGLVLGHAETVVLLGGCDLLVSETGRQRVLREQKKNVHAGVRGKITFELVPKCLDFLMEQVTYNPYKYDSFVLVEGEKPIHHTEGVYLSKTKRVYMMEG